MKKLLLCGLSAVLLAGCGEKQEGGQQPSEDQSVLRTVALDTEYEVNMPDSLKFDTASRYFYDLDVFVNWPETIEGRTPEGLQSVLVEKAFGPEMKGKTLEEAMSAVQSCVPGMEDMNGVTLAEADSIPSGEAGMRTTSLKVEVYPCYASASVYTYFISRYFYPAGAAHGVGKEYYVNYDPSEDKVVGLGMLFDNITELKRMIDRELSKQQAGTGFLLVDEIPNPENFYVDGYSITFVFNPYEVVAYAAGVVEVKIPAYELEGYMTDYGRELFGY